MNEAGVKELEEKFKVRFANADELQNKGRLSTGIPSLDFILDGGYPVGRIIEVFGGEETGKTSLLYTNIVSASNSDLNCLFIDGERSFDPVYIKHLGLAPGKLSIIKPQYGEQAFRVARGSLKLLNIKLIGLDSLTSLVPYHQFTNETENPIGLQARMMSNELRMLASAVDDYSAVCLLINQIRTHMAGMVSWQDSTAGRALRFYSSIRIGLEPFKVTSDCRYTKVFVKKNKTGAPLRSTTIRIVYGKGVDLDYDNVQLATLKGEAVYDKKGGGWYIYQDKKYRWKTLAKLLRGEVVTESDTAEDEREQTTQEDRVGDSIEELLANEEAPTSPEAPKRKVKDGKRKRSKEG